MGPYLKEIVKGERTVSTMLTHEEQVKVDAAGEGVYRTCHRQDITQVMLDVRTQRARVVLLSIRRCETSPGSRIFRAIREIPRVQTIALLSDVTNDTAQTLLLLGQQGVHQVVDVRNPSGWNKLRGLVTENCGDTVEQNTLAIFEQLQPSMSAECWNFFVGLVRKSGQLSSVRRLAEELDISPSTLMSRFFRLKLPAPKRYLAMVRLVRAAYLLENVGFSIANVSNHLGYSSPQSFGRHVRTMLGMTGQQFRKSYTGEKMLLVFEKQLVTPYLEIFAGFSPLSRLPYVVARANVKRARSTK